MKLKHANKLMLLHITTTLILKFKTAAGNDLINLLPAAVFKMTALSN